MTLKKLEEQEEEEEERDRPDGAAGNNSSLKVEKREESKLEAEEEARTMNRTAVTASADKTASLGPSEDGQDEITTADDSEEKRLEAEVQMDLKRHRQVTDKTRQSGKEGKAKKGDGKTIVQEVRAADVVREESKTVSRTERRREEQSDAVKKEAKKEVGENPTNSRKKSEVKRDERKDTKANKDSVSKAESRREEVRPTAEIKRAGLSYFRLFFILVKLLSLHYKR